MAETSSPLSLQQWFQSGIGRASSADSGVPDEPAYARYLEQFYTDKYNLDPSQTYDARMGQTYEQMLSDWDPDNVNYADGLARAEMTPERIQQIMQQAYASGDFLSGFEGALNPEEKAAYVAAQNYKPGWDGMQMFLMAALGSGLAAVVGPSIAASLGEAGFSNPFSGITNQFSGGTGTLPDSYWSMLAENSSGLPSAANGTMGLSPDTLSFLQSAGYTPAEIAQISGSFGADGALLGTGATSAIPSGDGFGGLGTDETLSGLGADEIAGGGNWYDKLLNGGGSLSTLAKLLGGSSEGSLAKLLGNLGAGALDAYGINQRNQDLKEIADRSWAAGAPSRSRYEASYAPGFTMNNDPGYTDALNSAAKGNAYSLSKTFGNPADSPTAQAQNMQDLFAKTAYPALQNYRNTNAGAGALATLAGQANTLGTNAAQGDADLYKSLGTTASRVFNPQPSIFDWLK